MPSSELHLLVIRQDLARLQSWLRNHRGSPEINAFDDAGYTPLMHAVKKSNQSPDIVKLLLECGADLSLERRGQYSGHHNVLSLALGGGNPDIVRLLMKAGADPCQRSEHGYSALIHAVHSRDILHDPRLLELLELLVANRVDLNTITDYRETALRVLSRIGQFDAVKLLLDAGADAGQLEWSPLLHAVAIGSLADVKRELEHGADLKDRDYWQRTPWLLSIHTGDLEKARLLYEKGADAGAGGRGGKAAISYAVEGDHPAMLRWLLEIGAGTADADESNHSALHTAVRDNHIEVARILIAAGADLEHRQFGGTPLGAITTREMGLMLLQAGADAGELKHEGHRLLLGLPPEEECGPLAVTPEEYARGKNPRFGQSNPERIDEPFWREMICTGLDSFWGAKQFNEESDFSQKPIWCADRFGQSITLMPDGRIIQIAGEHEDYYDPDFYIYNDVFVHRPGAELEVFGYPQDVFPPTDFHSATLVGDRHIWIIGSVGYEQRYGETPVYVLNTETMKIEAVPTTCTKPGWISRHRARLIAPNQIEISGGQVMTQQNGQELSLDNEKVFVLNVASRVWTQREQ